MKARSLVLIPLLLAAVYACTNGKAGSDTVKPAVNISSTRLKAVEAFQYCEENGFNTNFCILVDMSLHSGVSRFFIWNFSKDTILYSFPVGHGCCDNPWSS